MGSQALASGARTYLPYVRSHLSKVMQYGLATFGPDPCPMWMSSIDTSTGRYPENDHRPAHIGNFGSQFNHTPNGSPLHAGKRVYRYIDAPKGATLYWDQPALVAAHAMSQSSGEPHFGEGADAYVRAFLDRCVAGNGIFLWGNHYYFDAYQGKVVWFTGEEAPKPVDFSTEVGHLHETRPIPPAWELFWKLAPETTETCIRQIGERHIFDEETGGFNRHADKQRSHAFLEAGGILTETLAWLYDKTQDASLRDKALRVARYSFEHRNAQTGILETDPTSERWDKSVCTTEVGLWAQSLLRAEHHTGAKELGDMAEEAVAAYLRYGYDATARRYYGQLRVQDGSPVMGAQHTATVFQPGDYSDPWAPLFPNHDYPMPFAESCLSLFTRTSKGMYEDAVRRWATILQQTTPANHGQGAYAEHYGRGIHFLCGAAHVLHDQALMDQAHVLADEAISTLYQGDMFRGHPGENRYDAVDGVGFLLLSLLYLETGQQPNYRGFGF